MSTPQTTSKSAVQVTILGGGLAGICAAVQLQKAGKRVRLIEQRSILGGRAYSYQKPETPWLDNGQHITLACYQNYRRLLHDLGQSQAIAWQNDLTLHYAGRYQEKPVALSLVAGNLPAPLHLLQALQKLKILSAKDKLHASRFGWQIWQRAHFKKADMSVAQWLQQAEQPPLLCELLWEPICVGALNTSSQLASANLLANVLYQAFFVSRQASGLGVFQQSLLASHGESATQWLQQHAVELQMQTTVTSLVSDAGRVHAVIDDQGQSWQSDHFISALPAIRLQSLLDDKHQQLWPASQQFAQLQTSPIINAYLLYPKPVLKTPHLCLLGCSWQWVFDASHLLSPAAQQQGEQLLSLTLSAADRYLEQDNRSLAELAMRELQDVLQLPDHLTAKQHWVIKERRATLQHSVAIEKLRPEAITPWSNFYLAGDWTQTQLPCTLEGACRSGFHAADLLLAKMKENSRDTAGKLPASA